MEYVFIQFAGFTFGKSASAYATPWQGFPGNISSNLLGGQNTDTGVNNIQYTWEFGNGVSGSIGLDDPVVWDRTAVYNLALALNATLGGSNAYAGVHAPDVVGKIRVDQAWGLFEVSAAAHEVSGSYNILNAVGSSGRCDWSCRCGADRAVGNLRPSRHQMGRLGHGRTARSRTSLTGVGDDIKMDVSYAKGETKNVIATSGASPKLCDVRRHEPGGRLSERRLRCDHRCRVSPRRQRRRRFAASDGSLRHPRCVQPQLGSVLVVEPLWQLLGGPL